MRVFTLKRCVSSDSGTFGNLYFENQVVCKMAELPWRDNKANKSCIPLGEYRCDYLARSSSGKYRDVYHVQNVLNRSGVLIHKGNYVGDKDLGLKADSWGCLLPCTQVKVLGGQLAGVQSEIALNILHEFTNRESFILRIKNA